MFVQPIHEGQWRCNRREETVHYFDICSSNLSVKARWRCKRRKETVHYFDICLSNLSAKARWRCKRKEETRQGAAKYLKVRAYFLYLLGRVVGEDGTGKQDGGCRLPCDWVLWWWRSQGRAWILVEPLMWTILCALDLSTLESQRTLSTVSRVPRKISPWNAHRWEVYGSQYLQKWVHPDGGLGRRGEGTLYMHTSADDGGHKGKSVSSSRARWMRFPRGTKETICSACMNLQCNLALTNSCPSP